MPDAWADPARPLRILVVANLYPSPRHPAFGTFVAARVEALRAAGARVDVAAITDDRVHHGRARKYLRLGLWSFAAAVRSRLGPRYDVVEAHIAFPTGIVAWPAARIAGASLVLFAHGSDVLRLPWQSARHERLARWLFGQADLVVANSRSTAGVVEARLGPLRRAPLVASPGLDLPDEGGLGVRDAERILFVGRLVEGKGARVLVAAMDRLQHLRTAARLTIVGDGPDRAVLEATVAQSVGLRDRIDFVGPQAPSEVAAWYRRATVVVVPSIEPEGLGLVALEAMASGAIVVATAQGGLAEIVRDRENGLVVPPSQPQALAEAIAEALAAAADGSGDRWRAAGRRLAEQHERHASVARTLEAYETMCR